MNGDAGVGGSQMKEEAMTVTSVNVIHAHELGHQVSVSHHDTSMESDFPLLVSFCLFLLLPHGPKLIPSIAYSCCWLQLHGYCMVPVTARRHCAPVHGRELSYCERQATKNAAIMLSAVITFCCLLAAVADLFYTERKKKEYDELIPRCITFSFQSLVSTLHRPINRSTLDRGERRKNFLPAEST